MTIYKILNRSGSENFVEYVVRDEPTSPKSVLHENGYEDSAEWHIAKLVSPQEVINHYKRLNDEQEVVFDVVEKILRNHESHVRSV